MNYWLSLILISICLANSAIAKTYKGSELRKMVSVGKYPKVGNPKTETQTMSFETCRLAIAMAISQVEGALPTEVLVNTNLLYIAKIWLNDSQTVLSCSNPDSMFTTVTSSYR